MIQWNEETLENENSVAQILMLADKEWNARKQLYESYKFAAKTHMLACGFSPHLFGLTIA